MDPACRFLPSPGTPLFPVSPERANQQKPSVPDIPTSPSLPDLNSLSQGRTNPDVQGKVAQFNSLNREVVERRRANEAALRRAVIGREEAENETRKTREDLKRIARELEENRLSESKLRGQFDQVMADSQRAKETHLHSQTLYEKEIRRARKEAFKSSSALVKLQEELKATRESLRLVQSNVDEQKCLTEKREKEAFTAEYHLVSVQAELTRMREAIKVVEEERDTLKTTLREEEVARVAARGRITLPVVVDGGNDHEEADDLASPLGSKSYELSQSALKIYPSDGERISNLEKELQWTKTQWRKADKKVNYMKMECQFKCCSCRIAESQGTNYEHDVSFINAFSAIQKEMKEALTQLSSDDVIAAKEEKVEKSSAQSFDQAIDVANSPLTEKSNPFNNIDDAMEPIDEEPPEAECEVAFCPSAGTFHASTDPLPDFGQVMLSPAGVHDAESANALIRTADQALAALQSEPEPQSPASIPAETSLLSIYAAPLPEDSPLIVGTATTNTTTFPMHDSPSPPSSPLHRTVTTTTIIPLAREAPAPNSPSKHLPSNIPKGDRIDDGEVFLGPTMTREQAIEQIRLRRGRARSIAAGAFTPRKQMVEGAGTRRDISAPEMRWED